jgi:PAS domain-containing protein
MEHRELDDLDKNMQIMQKEYEEFLEQKHKLKPEFESLKVIIKYILLGTLWILFSDRLVTTIVRNPEMVEEIQLYKGWFYVFVTGGIFFVIINRVLNMYSSSVNKILSSYEELTAAHEELITMNDELREYIVEHEQLQESLRSEQELLNRIFTDASSIVVVFDIDENIIQYNPYAEQILGFQKEQMIGKKRKELFSDVHDSEMEVLCDDGSYKTILWSNNALHDKAGKVTGLVSVGTDITARREIEENLQRLAYYDTLTELPNKA